MAIVLQFNVTLARKVEIEARYDGGFAQFQIDWLTHARWCDDGQLLAVSSMGNDSMDMCASLKAHGVDVVTTNETQNCSDILSRCTWLDGSLHKVIQRELPNGTTFSQEIFKYWARGSEPGRVADYFRGLRRD